MLLEEKFLEFHRYASSHNLPLEAISVGDENKVLCEMHYAANAPRNIYSHTKSTRFRRVVPTQSLMESKAGDNLLV